MIFDTHTHLNVKDFAGEEKEVIERAVASGVSEMAIVGFDKKTIQKACFLAKKFPNLYSIIGWHPTEAGSFQRKVEVWLINEMVSSKKVIACGEIGLDYHWMKDSKEMQEKVFRRQLAIARELKKPVVIHTRKATNDTYRILKDEGVPYSGVMHSFSDNVEWMKRFLDLGMLISLSGVVTFKKSEDVHKIAKKVPITKLLVETDAPYLTPVPFRGKRNEPGYARYVVEEIAKLRNISWKEVAKQTKENAHNLFKLGKYA
ncbi:MAG: TatD family hydrolase [Streptococcaceae bacterium]|jgi:TatD DNase family protein|nr:TatD family hydrolase [Streptococcaceae bacterium]